MRELDVAHGLRIAVETVYQALYSPMHVVERDAARVLRTERPHRRPRRRGDVRRPRFAPSPTGAPLGSMCWPSPTATRPICSWAPTPRSTTPTPPPRSRGETTANGWLLIALGSDAASSETPDDLVASIVSIEGLSRLSRGAGGSEAPPAGNEWCASTSPPHVPRRSAYAGSTGAGSQGHDRRVRIVRVAVFGRRVGGVGCGQHDEHPNVRANVRLARERCSGPW